MKTCATCKTPAKCKAAGKCLGKGYMAKKMNRGGYCGASNPAAKPMKKGK